MESIYLWICWGEVIEQSINQSTYLPTYLHTYQSINQSNYLKEIVSKLDSQIKRRIIVLK